MYRFIGKKEGEFLVIQDQELQHLKVLRLKDLDMVEVNDLNGNIYEGQIIEINKKKAIVKPLKKLNIEDEDLNITLMVCVPNQPSKIDDLIEPISQLGVNRLIPVISKRSAIKISDIIKKKEKWEKIGLNSIKQCKRVFPLKIENPVELPKINIDNGLKFVFYEKESFNNLKTLNIDSFKDISIIIGPEGGFEDREIDILKEKGFIPLTLGKNILKFETAVIVSICQIKFKFS